MNNGFCVILTKDRLYQAVALYRSLRHNTKAMKLNMFILCLDNETLDILNKMQLEKVTLIHVNEIENEHLSNKKQERKINEYCWTLKPIFLQYVFDKFPHIDRVTYLDADLCFFGDPAQIFFDAPHCIILLSRHDFLENYKFVEDESGKYNSGFISFKRHPISYDCLKWWKERCLEWCHDRSENGKFGDQKYLDMMPSLFSGVCDINTPGVNIAPWNHGKYKISVKEGNFYVNNDRLIFYHYCGLRLVSHNLMALTVGFDKKFIPLIHKPYIYVLKDVIKDISAVAPTFNGYYIEEGRKPLAEFYEI
ncbi:glycosyltransferase [Thermotalea metallivorans]|uniref:Nucleotide-diphospho-sugar transferase domain-containing protein n=1 Tax=Thermotalea metallivorans TaxID=520762 RepID=A0A140L0H7_9FIRM|nr:glycosyltransferase [Thermotalea metallivorans]KXG74052.1 hypothetical protein AN619_26620 [Thermotalea metallivorans]